MELPRNADENTALCVQRRRRSGVWSRSHLNRFPRARTLVRPLLVVAALATAAGVAAFATSASSTSRAMPQLRAPAGVHPTVAKGDDKPSGDADHKDKSPPLRTIPPAPWPHPGDHGRAYQAASQA